MQLSFFIKHSNITAGSQYPYPVIFIAGNCNDIIVLQFRVLCHKIFFNALAIEHIEPIARRDPEVALLIGTNIIYPKIRKAVAGIKVLESYTLLGNGFYTYQSSNQYNKEISQ